MRGRFATGVGVLFGGTIAFLVVRTVMPYLITGTTYSENMLTYIVPIALFAATISMVIIAWFYTKPPKRQ